MRAIRVNELGGPEQLVLENLPSSSITGMGVRRRSSTVPKIPGPQRLLDHRDVMALDLGEKARGVGQRPALVGVQLDRDVRPHGLAYAAHGLQLGRGIDPGLQLERAKTRGNVLLRLLVPSAGSSDCESLPRATMIVGQRWHGR